MADLPIIFSGPMVRALLDGRKTMTRRRAGRYRKVRCKVTGEIGYEGEQTEWVKVKPGDRLYVRESFAILPRNCYALPKTPAPDPDMAAYYLADFDRSGKPGWKPSIHMPRWASRLTLLVEAVKIERLQEISEEDAKAEGCFFDVSRDCWCYEPNGYGYEPSGGARRAFSNLWEKLHGRDSWNANPELVAISFKVVRENIDKVTA